MSLSEDLNCKFWLSFSEKLQEERDLAEERAEKRIELYIQSAKKSRKRKRIFDDDEEEYVPSIQLHQEQVRIQVMVVEYHRVPTLPGKPGILSFSFPGLENAWNLPKKW